MDAREGVVRRGAARSSTHPLPSIAPSVTPIMLARGCADYGDEAVREPRRAGSGGSRWQALPVDGVGLLRAEFMILSALGGTHPRQLLQEGRGGEFVERMADNLRTFAAAFAPRPVIYRSMDFRTNEFRGLQGGAAVRARRAKSHDRLPRLLPQHQRAGSLRTGAVARSSRCASSSTTCT